MGPHGGNVKFTAALYPDTGSRYQTVLTGWGRNGEPIFGSYTCDLTTGVLQGLVSSDRMRLVPGSLKRLRKIALNRKSKSKRDPVETVGTALAAALAQGVISGDEYEQAEYWRVAPPDRWFVLEKLRQFRRWREEVDCDHLLDTYDLCLGFLSGAGISHDTATAEAAKEARER